MFATVVAAIGNVPSSPSVHSTVAIANATHEFAPIWNAYPTAVMDMPSTSTRVLLIRWNRPIAGICSRHSRPPLMVSRLEYSSVPRPICVMEIGRPLTIW